MVRVHDGALGQIPHLLHLPGRVKRAYHVSFLSRELKFEHIKGGALNIEYNIITPRDTINRVINSLSENYPDDVTLLLVDEVYPCGPSQTTPDWRDLEVRENVIWLLGLSPAAYGADSTEVLPPVNSSVLTRPLIYKHRNCPQIRNFIKTINAKLFSFEIFS